MAAKNLPGLDKSGIHMKGQEVKYANPKLGMRNCLNITKMHIYPLANMGLAEFSLCPETHFKGICKVKVCTCTCIYKCTVHSAQQ